MCIRLAITCLLLFGVGKVLAEEAVRYDLDGKLSGRKYKISNPEWNTTSKRCQFDLTLHNISSRTWNASYGPGYIAQVRAWEINGTPVELPTYKADHRFGRMRHLLTIIPGKSVTVRVDFQQTEKLRGEYILQIWDEIDVPGVGKVIVVSNPVFFKTPEE